MCIPHSKAKWDLGIFVNFSYPDTNFLNIPSYTVSSCCLYLYCFSPAKLCSLLPLRHLCSYWATLFYNPKPEIFTVARNVSHLQCFSLWVLYHHRIVIEMNQLMNTDFRWLWIWLFKFLLSLFLCLWREYYLI